MSAPEPSSLLAEPLSELLVDELLEGVLERICRTPERLQQLLDERREALFAFRAERTIVYANEAAERFFGYGRRELEGRSTDAIVPARFPVPDAPPQVATQDLTTVELPALRADGTEIGTVWTYAAAG